MPTSAAHYILNYPWRNFPIVGPISWVMGHRPAAIDEEIVPAGSAYARVRSGCIWQAPIRDFGEGESRNNPQSAVTTSVPNPMVSSHLELHGVKQNGSVSPDVGYKRLGREPGDCNARLLSKVSNDYLHHIEVKQNILQDACSRSRHSRASGCRVACVLDAEAKGNRSLSAKEVPQCRQLRQCRPFLHQRDSASCRVVLLLVPGAVRASASAARLVSLSVLVPWWYIANARCVYRAWLTFDEEGNVANRCLTSGSCKEGLPDLES